MAQDPFCIFLVWLGSARLAPSGGPGLRGFRVGLCGLYAGLRGFCAGLRGLRAGLRGFHAGLCSFCVKLRVSVLGFDVPVLVSVLGFAVLFSSFRLCSLKLRRWL